jgi:hypothetical protein
MGCWKKKIQISNNFSPQYSTTPLLQHSNTPYFLYIEILIKNLILKYFVNYIIQ